MHGPFDLALTAVTRVLEATPAESLSGSAQVGRSARGRMRWELTPHHGGTWVHLCAELEQANVIDRLLLALGARRWFSRRFAAVIRRLGDRFSRPWRPRPRNRGPRRSPYPPTDSSGENLPIADLHDAHGRRGRAHDGELAETGIESARRLEERPDPPPSVGSVGRLVERPPVGEADALRASGAS
jgi:hypothetical protein